MTCTRLLAAALAVALSTSAASAALPRRALIGVLMPAAQQGGHGATISEIVPGASAAALGLRPGDTIVRAGDRTIAAPADLGAYASTLVAGDPLRLRVRRGNRELSVSGRAVARPFDAYPGAHVDYGEVPFRGGALRDILVLPDGIESPPVVFLLQGFSCVTIENGLYHALAVELLRAGIGFYRVEKPGIGDSAGTPDCRTIDYATELDGFRAAWRHLTNDRHVAADHVFMLGHSLGGLEAPMLAAERPPRGVVVYGAVLRNWADYHRDLIQFQPYLMFGQDPVEASARAERFRDALRLFYFGREAPAAITASNPALDGDFREFLGWDGGENILGRNYRFTQDLAGLPLMAAWRDTHSNVLALYGESDLVALTDVDHRLIADIANHYRPGSGTFMVVPGTGHGMDLVGSPLELRRRMVAANGALPSGPLNPEVARALIAWIQGAMARPPVG